MVAHKLHQLAAQVLRLQRAVAHAHVVHQVAQAHDAEANAARLVGCLAQRRHSRHISVCRYHIIQKARAQHHRLAQLVPVQRVVGAKVLGQIDGPKAAIFIRSQPLLAARVGSLKRVQMRNRIGAVGRIQKQHAGLAIMVRLLHNHFKQFARAASLHHLAAVRCQQIKCLVITHCFHELVGDANRNVEVGNLVFVALAADELAHIRMVHAQHSHVRATAGAALCNLTKGAVVDAQEAHRPGGHPGG